jgi:hypothetical protein
MKPPAEHRIDLTSTTDPAPGIGRLRYVEILTDGGLIRVNVNLADPFTLQLVIAVDAEPAEGWDALTTSHSTGGAALKLTSRERWNGQ